jgi:hypothetical protein
MGMMKTHHILSARSKVHFFVEADINLAEQNLEISFCLRLI